MNHLQPYSPEEIKSLAETTKRIYLANHSIEDLKSEIELAKPVTSKI